MCEYSSVHKIPQITGRCLKISVEQRPLDTGTGSFSTELIEQFTAS